MLKKTLITLLIIFAIILGVFIFLETYTPPLSKNHGKVQTRLYLGESENQPLIVGFGGSEGGNAWDRDFWKPTRDKFLEKGYAFLAIGYFGTKETPNNLDRISLDAIHDAIIEISKNPKIHSQKIAIIGGSKGGELVLNLASYFDDIDAVVAMSASHVSFSAITNMSNTSSWTLNDKQLPFIPIPYSALPAMISGKLLDAYNIILENKEEEEKALIPVENINGHILLLSPTKDELWPSRDMSKKIIERLESKGFKNYFEHVVVEGNHAEPTKHFNLVFEFLEKVFPVE